MPNQQPNLEEQFNQPPPPDNLPQKPKFNLKYILIILGLAILVGGGILAYQYWWLPKQETKPPEITIKDETAGWQTYRNEELGIEFKYPKPWGEVTKLRLQGPTECEMGTRIVSGTEIRLNFSGNSYINPGITLYFTTPDYKSAICYIDREEIIPGFTKEEELKCKPYLIGISQVFECRKGVIADSPAIIWYNAIQEVQVCGYFDTDKHIKVISPSQNFPGVYIIAYTIPAANYYAGCYENRPNITLEDFINMRLEQLKENQLPSESQQFLREFDNFVKTIKFIK